jgi:predicted phage terminase large subunit-like protein
MPFNDIVAQQGPQQKFLENSANIVLYGGSAGSGKTFAILLECLRNVANPNFSAIVFRRVGTMISAPGGLWDASSSIYPQLGAKAIEHKFLWRFPSGAKIKFQHLEHESNCYDHQGGEYPLIIFDELVHFTKKQFMYLMSRNRSTCGVKPYMRATCNPDSGSWVKEIIDWWIDPDTGLPISERSGVIRWFVVLNEDFIWFDSEAEAREAHPDIPPISFTFISAMLADNKILMEKDPGYRAKLLALPLIERERLLSGNWLISEQGGIIKKEWIQLYTELPEVKYYWWSIDSAIKEKQESDFSVAQLWACCANGYYLTFSWRGKVPYPILKQKVESLYALYPAREVLIEDKSSGQQLIQDFKAASIMPVIAMMPGKNEASSKIERVNFVSTLFEAGKVFVKANQEWTRDTIDQWCAFPAVRHDDDTDAMSQALSRRLNLNDAITTPTNICAAFSANDPFVNVQTTPAFISSFESFRHNQGITHNPYR